MRIDDFLSPLDAGRVQRIFAKLNASGLTDYAVTGGLALETVLGHLAGQQRPLNDIDLVVSGIDAIPPLLGKTFLVRHAHPNRRQGKLLIQFVDAEDAVRFDIFSACGATLARSRSAQIGSIAVKIVTIEDMASRIASEMMDFVRGEAIPSKCAADYSRVVGAVDPVLVETAWQEQRRTIDPDTFAEARSLIDNGLQIGSGRLFEHVYSDNVSAVCMHCEDREPFRLAKPETIVSALGYY
jgi:hypothetical protein